MQKRYPIVVVLRKGEKLYSGRVDEMVSSYGFFELRADNSQELINLLNNHEAFGKVKELDGLITAFLDEPIDATAINKLAFENSIVLSHLVKRKPSLEEQFLQLTDNQN